MTQAKQVDELMIDWGNVPVGSVASIYWPQVPSAQVLALADSLYKTRTLTLADAHTIQCKVTGGVTYIHGDLLQIAADQMILEGAEGEPLFDQNSFRIRLLQLTSTRGRA